MATVEIVGAVILFFSRWTNRPAVVALAILAVFQAGQSYAYEQVRYSANDPVIPIDNLGVVVLCVVVISLIAAGPSRSARRCLARIARDPPPASTLGRASRENPHQIVLNVGHEFQMLDR